LKQALIVAAKRLPPGLLKDLAGFLPACLTTVRRLRNDPRVPRRAKLVILLAGLWLLSPIDLLPEFLPVIGPLDDVLVIALALRYAARSVPRPVLLGAPGPPIHGCWSASSAHQPDQPGQVKQHSADGITARLSAMTNPRTPAKERWLGPGVAGIGTASFLADVGHEIPTALLPNLLTATLGAPASALGLIEGISDGLAGAARLAGGALADDPPTAAAPWRSAAIPPPLSSPA
jgi:hypothetical protein